MSNSKRAKRSHKPDKPYEGFPLFAHASKQWAKKIRGRMHYFGGWAEPEAALKRFNSEWPYLKEGRIPPPVDVGDGCTLQVLCNTFLTTKKAKLESGELAAATFTNYHSRCEKLIDYFGPHRRVDDLRPDDFERFRSELAKSMGVTTLQNTINQIRIILKYAFDQRLIDRPVLYGQSFEKPAARTIRKSRNEAGPKLFTSAELRRILEAADPIMRAMVLLACNGGLGNTDIGNLPQDAIDFETGWLDYPRPKTQIARRIPLWDETLEAVRVAIDQRPTPKDPADANLVFLTATGLRCVRTIPSKKNDRFNAACSVAERFGALLRKLEINGRRGRGFYTCRHCFETVAGESRDQVAVDSIMGHVDPSMAAAYRQSISDQRLQAVVDTVRAWLFGENAPQRIKPSDCRGYVLVHPDDWPDDEKT